jgi:hypothetical protein
VRSRVSRTNKRTAYALQVLTARDGEGVEQTLRVTEEHPFFVQFAGWTAAKSLEPGDTILGADGTLAVVSNEYEAHPRGVAVYNLEVEQAHTYFVLAEDAPAAAAVWVHNANYNQHHPINKAIGGKKKQITYSVERDLEHMPFHRSLQVNLDAANIPIRTMGGRGGINSAPKIAAYFFANRGSQRTVFDVLIRTAREYDANNGTRFLDFVKHNLVRENYKRIGW